MYYTWYKIKPGKTGGELAHIGEMENTCLTSVGKRKRLEVRERKRTTSTSLVM
jgi:hypothetical protein